MECDNKENNAALFTPSIEPGIWVKYKVNDSESWSQAKCILPADYCYRGDLYRIFIDNIHLDKIFVFKTFILLCSFMYLFLI